MYSQGLIGADGRTEESPEFLAAFQARIDAEEKIEPNDAMPEGYRRTLVRQIGQHAHSEIVGMLPEGNWITRAPSLRRKAALLAKVQDEGGHGLYLYAAAETLGVTRKQMTEELLDGTRQVLLDLQLPDPQLGRHRHHRLAGGRCCDHEPDPALPLLLRSLCAGHDPCLQGRKLSSASGLRDRDDAGAGHTGAEGDGAGQPEPLVVAVADDVRPARFRHRASAISRWRGRSSGSSNDELRQKFIDATVPQAEYLGLSIPDPDLAWNEEKSGYDHGPIDWDEFWRVVKGHGPMARDRIAARRKAWEDGAWVREAALAHAEKRRARKMAAE